MTIICSSCGCENPEDAAFCSQCGVVLALVCGDCGRSNGPDSGFCNSCGNRLGSETATDDAVPLGPAPVAAPSSYTPPHLAEKILRDRSQLAGERRTVTVLFCDAVGFTSMSEMLDEEVVYDLMQGCLQHMMDAVHRYEGTITQFRGDGVMALFGAPLAHEDSARRAVAAALDMQVLLGEYRQSFGESHRVDCRFRVGLNTGPVVVGTIGDNLQMDFTALGDTVNLAARMEQSAEPGTVCLSEQTYRAVSDYFECESLGSLMVKGKAEATPAYRAIGETGVRTRLDAAIERGLTPFVGRTHELRALHGHLEQCQRGQGQVVLVSGEAGIGKSRMLVEFQRSLGDDAAWTEGHCSAFGTNTPYLSIAEFVKRRFEIDESDTESGIIERVDAATADWPETARALVPYLKFLLNVSPGDAVVATMDPMERRAGIYDALREMLNQAGSQRSQVVVIEDLHWIDQPSEAALIALVDVIATLPILLVLTARPAYRGPLGERSDVSRLALAGLAPDDSAQIAREVLRVANLSGELDQLIAERTEGNPFYVEEVTKALLEAGALMAINGSYELARAADQIDIPDNIQGVILSRIDRLDRPARDAIQLASVIGREFTVRVLDRIADTDGQIDDALGDLRVLELIHQTAYFPELSFMFKHALTQDVAYSTLLLERRKALHRLVAVAIEDLYADRLTEHLEMLAHHWFEAEDWQKAARFYKAAGDKATAAFAHTEAVESYERCLESCDRHGGDTLLPLTLEASRNKGLAHCFMGDLDGAVVESDRSVAVAKLLGGGRTQIWCHWFRAVVEFLNHNRDDMAAAFEDALAVARKEGDDKLVQQAHLMFYLYMAAWGDTSRADEQRMPHEELSLSVGSDGIDDEFASAVMSTLVVLVANWRADFSFATSWFADSKAPSPLAAQLRRAGDWNASLALVGRGDYQEALDRLLEQDHTLERMGALLIRSRVQNTVGWILGEILDFDEAMTWNERGVRLAQQVITPDAEIESNARLNLGDNLLELGRLDEAEEQYRWVERIYRDPTAAEEFLLWRYSQHCLHSYGELWLKRGDTDRALAYAEECLTHAVDTESRKNVAKARRLRGQALQAQGHLQPAAEELGAALTIAKEVGNPTQLWKTHAAIADLARAGGDTRAAAEAYREALAVIDDVAERLDAERGATFLAAQPVTALREALEQLGA